MANGGRLTAGIRRAVTATMATARLVVGFLLLQLLPELEECSEASCLPGYEWEE